MHCMHSCCCNNKLWFYRRMRLHVPVLQCHCAFSQIEVRHTIFCTMTAGGINTIWTGTEAALKNETRSNPKISVTKTWDNKNVFPRNPLISGIISTRMNDSISYHDAVHGFWRKQGTTTAISELKLCMRATKMNKKVKPRFLIFLDLKKGYDALDQSRTLEILKLYGVGPNICHIIEQTWEMDQMIPKQAGILWNHI